MAVIASDGYFPRLLSVRKRHIPVYAIVCMAALAFALILAGSLQVILEFGSVTFLLVSLLMAYANFRIRDLTQSSSLFTLFALSSLLVGTSLILYYEFTHQAQQLIFIGGLYLLLTLGAWTFSRQRVSPPAA